MNENKNVLRSEYGVIGERNYSLWDLYVEFKDGGFICPEWQRWYVWQNDNEKCWFQDVKDGIHIPGTFVVFRTDDSSKLFLNDGFQRISATAKFIEKMAADGFSDADIQRIVTKATVSVQKCHYKDMKTAFLNFFTINLGTLTTPYELGKGIITTNLSNYNLVWKPIIGRLHETMQTICDRMGCKQKKGRDAKHKLLRDDFGLFVRYLSKDSSNSDYKAGQKRLNRSDIQGTNPFKKIIENRVQDIFNELGQDKIEQELEKFKLFVERYIAIYEDHWYKSVCSKGNAPTPTHIHVFLAACIYAHNNSIPLKKLEEFANNLIVKTDGSTSISFEGKRNVVTLSLSNMSKIGSICDYIGVKDFAIRNKSKRAKQNTSRVKAGYHKSHKKAFSKHGEGETVIEPAPRNLLRGREDMTPDEIKAVS